MSPREKMPTPGRTSVGSTGRHPAFSRAAQAGRPSSVWSRHGRDARIGSSRAVLDEAVETLARLRTPYWLGDTGVRLHALASLLAQTHALLPDAVADARDQDLTSTEIGQLLGLTPDTAARRYRPHQ